MSRGYDDSCDGDRDYPYDLYRATVGRSFDGKRGQAFMRELVALMDAMPVRELCRGELEGADGQHCTLGIMYVARGKSIPNDMDYDDMNLQAARDLNISLAMATDIAGENDRCDFHAIADSSKRWTRMRAWAQSKILGAAQ